MQERVKYLNTGDDEEVIHIYPTRNLADFSYPVVLIFIWIIGVLMIGNQYFNSDQTGMYIFLIILSLLWIMCGIFLIYVFVWRLKGREVVKINAERLSVGKEIPGWQTFSDIPVEKIKSLGLTRSDERAVQQSMSMNYFGIMGGTVRIETDEEVTRLGIQLSEQDAKKLLDKIRNVMPSR